MKNLYENAKGLNHQDTLEKQAGHTFPIRHEDLKSSIMRGVSIGAGI